MKILYCTLTGKSGADVYFRLLAQTQKKLNAEIEFLSYHRYWSLNPNFLRPFVKIDMALDIIHSNAEYSFVFYRSQKPLIVTVHCIITNPFKVNYLSLAQRFYYQLQLKYIKQSVEKATYIITVAHATEEVVRDLYNVNNIITMYNGVDIDLFKPITIDNAHYPDKIKLLFVGNLTRRKGVDLLEPIMAELDNRFLLFYTTGLRTPKKIFSDKRMIPIGRLTQAQLVYWYNLCDIL
ncbi:MAG: glycosyltransferase family 4 protein, partial [candidate division WOR-3 bacterium]|nr:glycosyltransferase family 4 protein [candidate division WOR-3 bacterium]